MTPMYAMDCHFELKKERGKIAKNKLKQGPFLINNLQIYDELFSKNLTWKMPKEKQQLKRLIKNTFLLMLQCRSLQKIAL